MEHKQILWQITKATIFKIKKEEIITKNKINKNLYVKWISKLQVGYCFDILLKRRIEVLKKSVKTGGILQGF